MTRALPTFFAIALLASSSVAQSSAILHVNDVQMQVHSNGFIGGVTGSVGAGFTLPGGASTMYASGLWMGGAAPDNQLKLSAHLFNTGFLTFFPGPLTVDGSASITPEVSAAYDQVWSVTAVELELHRAYNACLADPNCTITEEFPDGYTIPASILNWPAHGEVDAAQDFFLAPFYDTNLDGHYDPVSGDYPCTAGDGALFVIYNDKAEPGGQPIGVEVHMMPFAYANEDPFLAQTVFVHYRIINRGIQTLTDFRIGNFADLDIGCANDDLVGTDVGRSMVYAYNGDDVDDALCAGELGFGEQPPAFGMVILNGPRLDFDGLDNADDPAIPAFNGSGYGDGTIDNERHGLDQSMYFNLQGDFARTDPATISDFANQLHSSWKDGTPLTHGGDGYAQTPGALATLFAYPGASDPLGLGTDAIPQAPWSANFATSSPDPRGLASMGPITLEPGDEHDILIAYVYARATTGGALASVAALQQRVDSVAAFAETIPGLMANGTACDAVITSSIRDNGLDHSTLSFYPVPATNTLNVRALGLRPGTVLQIFDGQGALVAHIPTTRTATTIDVAALAPGLYTAKATGANTVLTGRFIKE